MKRSRVEAPTNHLELCGDWCVSLGCLSLYKGWACVFEGAKSMQNHRSKNGRIDQC